MPHVQPVSEKIHLKEGKKPKFHYKFIKSSSGLDSIKKLKEKYTSQLPPSKFTLQSKVIIEGRQCSEKNLNNPKEVTQPNIFEKEHFNRIKQLENENLILKKNNKNLTQEVNRALEDQKK